VLLIGIDEAGYGPILGPLVVAGVMLRCPGEPDPGRLWRDLADVIAERPRKRDPRLTVCDSKKLSSRPDGLLLLERAGLVATALAGLRIERWRGLLRGLDADVVEPLQACPWYRDEDPALPMACDSSELSLHVAAIGSAMRRQGWSVEAVAATILPANRYNALLARCGNKAVVLWSATVWALGRLLRDAADRARDEPVTVVLDRQGGRTNYRAAVQRAFDPVDLAELQRSPACSRYRMILGGQTVELAFLKDADAVSAPTAWASIVAKYTRETCMRMLNRWWTERVEGLKPTAGYLPDGRRFARQIAEHFGRLSLSADLVIRRR